VDDVTQALLDYYHRMGGVITGEIRYRLVKKDGSDTLCAVGRGVIPYTMVRHGCLRVTVLAWGWVHNQIILHGTWTKGGTPELFRVHPRCAGTSMLI